MILGQARTPFQRPAGASADFQPKLPDVGFYSHFQPFTNAMLPMGARSMYRPPLPPQMGPVPLPPTPAPALPAVPGAPVAAASPAPGGVAGAGFGSTGGTRGFGRSHIDPYMVMRAGIIPGVSPSGSNIRNGVTNAYARVNGGRPYQTAPLPPPPAPMPPAVTAVVPSTGIKGFLGALGFPPTIKQRRHPKRHWWSGEPVAADPSSCERIGPRLDGMYVTICNGRVTAIDDGKGNTQQNPYG